MATYNLAMLTDMGRALLAKAQAGQTTIEFTKLVTGDGSYADGEDFSVRTALKSQVQEFPLTYIDVVDSTTVYVRSIVSNDGLAVGYPIKEIGIYAKDPDEGEILYSMTTAVNEQWDFLPAYNNLLPSTTTIEFYAEVHNATQATFTVVHGTYASAEDLNAHVTNKNNPHKMTADQLGLGNVDNTSDMDKPVSTAQADAIAEAKKEAGTEAQKNLTDHNTSDASHADLRAALQELDNWVKDLLDSDDETLNEMHEVVAYIKSNKNLIDAITTSKVSVTDIVNDLVTNVSNKPLSAAQGVALKALIDAITTSKISVDKIVDDLLTANASKVLSANQGVVLKGLIDQLSSEIVNKVTMNEVNSAINSAIGAALAASY